MECVIQNAVPLYSTAIFIFRLICSFGLFLSLSQFAFHVVYLSPLRHFLNGDLRSRLKKKPAEVIGFNSQSPRSLITVTFSPQYSSLCRRHSVLLVFSLETRSDLSDSLFLTYTVLLWSQFNVVWNDFSFRNTGLVNCLSLLFTK